MTRHDRTVDGVAVAWVILSAVASAADGPTAAATPDQRYAALSLTNLPPLEEVLQAAFERGAAEIPDVPDWSRQMRRAVWVPRLEVRYGMGEARFRDYAIVDRREWTTGSETERERETSRSGGATYGPAGDLLDTSASGGRRDSSRSRSFSSVTELGPDSFNLGEHPRWLQAWEVALLWDLSLLFFRPEEIDAARARSLEDSAGRMLAWIREAAG